MPKLIPPGRRGPFWYLRGYDGKRRYEYSTGETTRRGAEAFKADFLARRERDRLPGSGTAIGFDRACDAFIAFRNPSRENLALLERAKRWFGDKPLAEILHANAVDAANSILPNATGPTKNRKVIVPIAAVMHYAADQGWCSYRRFKKFPEPRRSPRKPATEHTMSLLLANTEGHRQAFLACLYETGLRVTDALRIEWAAVNLPAGRLLVRVGKTDERIAIPLSAAFVALLANLPKAGPYVFPWRTRRGVYVWLKRLCAKLGVTYTPHMSRHALATAALEAGIPDREAADLGAWRDARSLHRYQHVSPVGVAGRSVGTLWGESQGAVEPKPLKGKQ